MIGRYRREAVTGAVMCCEKAVSCRNFRQSPILLVGDVTPLGDVSGAAARASRQTERCRDNLGQSQTALEVEGRTLPPLLDLDPLQVLPLPSFLPSLSVALQC
ncbi:hypothetical protein E2C01_048941 [Portunus trituberculatus]|uniref:Uncharacterized protein n=1 Tax=Portunus trituberculatus TaxID=210409 RepID=A0A5B7G4D0_PORTR|nr:hypothetical protein [Portunus trituberculatus]